VDDVVAIALGPARDLLEEFGAPLVVPRTRNGFGSRVMKTLIEQTGGTIAFDWREDGLCCKLIIPKPED
jgi:two-component sensor histidine kinase